MKSACEMDFINSGSMISANKAQK